MNSGDAPPTAKSRTGHNVLLLDGTFAVKPAGLQAF